MTDKLESDAAEIHDLPDNRPDFNLAAYSPAIACPEYAEFANRYGVEILKEAGDLQIVDGDLAMTRDLDLRLGDEAYDAMRRLLDDWRHKAPHVELLFTLMDLMVKREQEAKDRLRAAEREALAGPYEPFKLSGSEQFKSARNAFFLEEEAAQAGRNVYPGCIVMLGSFALTRFRDDIRCSTALWNNTGPTFGGHSVGELLVASANGVRHQDEWFKTRPPSRQQLLSLEVVKDALGEQPPHNTLAYSAGRCEEVVHLLSRGGGYDGFTRSMFEFAHEIAIKCREAA